jgi:1,4-dihydroxy-2-naphthoate octaprenyltransferase
VGVGDLARGYVYEIRPLPMLAAMLSALLGAALAGDARAFPPQGALVFLGLYAGHCMDSYVDYHVRHEPKFVYLGVFEDSGGLLGPRALLLGAGLSAALFLALLAALHASLAFTAAALLGLAIALCYAPFLDMRPWSVSAAYPTGVLLALLGGALLAAPGAPAARVAAVGLVVWVYLVGGKVVSDLIDLDSDRAFGKRTVAVVLGPRGARRVGYALCAAGLGMALALAALGAAPRTSALGALLAAPVLAASFRLPPERGVLLVVGAGYLWLLSLLAALAFAWP